MDLSRDVGEPIVKAFESCLSPVKGRPGFFTAYRCPAGVVTIGWGTTSEHGHTVRMGDVWSQAQCDQAFTSDATVFARHVEKMLRGTKVTQAQFDALHSWSYNTGGPETSAVWTYARKGDVEETCIRLARWNKGGGQVLRGLVRRRDAECALYRGQIDEALRIAGTKRATINYLAEPSGRATDRPAPPATEIARRTTKEAGAVAGGVGTTSAAAGSKSTTVQPYKPAAPPAAGGFPYSTAFMALGAALVIVGAALLIRKIISVRADWA
ncbi:lysozyme [Rhodoplanes sp. TEM]|uniref:Lysozyme n=1 Tax=Rhodoplanes tepidamans TaxID=200616 RepID=A0ABT5J586_RHOTP|nr:MULTISPECIES: lysozyme [Rhodoplanes]MDC7784748.1 lysozyme [Rhodoplanes tepidamans]MDC7982215.1 lysozyme [Rhodoplanes sp. TEM]MDQ0356221.1 lysozyme [Rhodoplanes tepidamans]